MSLLFNRYAWSSYWNNVWCTGIPYFSFWKAIGSENISLIGTMMYDSDSFLLNESFNKNKLKFITNVAFMNYIITCLWTIIKEYSVSVF